VTDYIPKNYPGYSSSSKKDVDISSYVSWHKAETDEQVFRATLRARLMARSLGEVVYGQKIYTTYPSIPTVYAKLVQDQSGKIAIVELNQNQGVETYERDLGAPVWQYGRNAAHWSYDYANEEPVWYGKTPSLETTEGPLSLGQSIQMSSKFIVRQVPGGYHLNTISLNRPSDVVYWDGSTRSFIQAGKVFPSRSLPSNLWCADALMHKWSLNGFADYIVGLEKDPPYTIQMAINEQAGWEDKAVYDPCPVGYHVPTRYLAEILYFDEVVYNSDIPSISHVHRDKMRWTGLYSHTDDKHRYYYTGPDHSKTFGFLIAPLADNVYNYANLLPFLTLGNILQYNSIEGGLFTSMVIYANDETGNVGLGAFYHQSMTGIRPMDEDVQIDPRAFPRDATYFDDWVDFMNNYN
jgi:hypothetical protein